MSRIFSLIIIFLSLLTFGFSDTNQTNDNTRAATGGAQTLEDILARQKGENVDYEFRNNLKYVKIKFNTPAFDVIHKDKSAKLVESAVNLLAFLSSPYRDILILSALQTDVWNKTQNHPHDSFALNRNNNNFRVTVCTDEEQ